MYNLFHQQEGYEGPFLICLELSEEVLKKLRCPGMLTVEIVLAMLTKIDLITLLRGNGKIGPRSEGA